MGGSVLLGSLAASQRTQSGDRCKKKTHGIKGIEETFTLHAFFFRPPSASLSLLFV